MKRTNALLSMIFGIASLVGIWGNTGAFYVSIVCIALGVLGLYFNSKAPRCGMATAGKITSMIGIIVSVIGLVWGSLSCFGCGGRVVISCIKIF